MPWRGTEGFQLNQYSVDARAPALSGVYALFNDGRWIYFGERENIRDRLTQHVNHETNPCIGRSSPRLFAYALPPNYSDAIGLLSPSRAIPRLCVSSSAQGRFELVALVSPLRESKLVV